MKKLFKHFSVLVIFSLFFSVAGEIVFQNEAEALTGGPDSYGHIYKDSSELGVSYSWNDISGTGTSVGALADESVYGIYDFGFTFNYYGNNYTQFYISNNGYIIFNNTSGYTNTTIPDAAAPNNFIMAYWTDLNTAGNIYYLMEGSAPNRTMTVSWNGVEEWGQTGPVTFQIILYETSNKIKFQYQDVIVNGASYDYGASASVGIENSDGTVGLQFSANTASLSDNYAIEFSIPSVYTQSAYRLFANANSTDVGSALAAQNTAYSLTAAQQEFRLRMLVHVSGADLADSDGSFKLQYVAKGTGSCSSPSGGPPYSWTDIGGSTLIAFKNNATPTDGSALTSNANDPTHSTDTIVNQTYEENNNFSNTEGAINAGQDGKWDFSLYDNKAAPGSTYCIRAATSDGIEFTTYSAYPEITVYGGPDSYGYVYRNTTYSWNDISGTGTSVGANGDESVYGIYNFGFTFNYYGTDYTQFYIGNNGFISFSGDGGYLNTSIPTAATPNNLIMAYWDDLYTAGNVKYLMEGSAPNRRMTVSWLAKDIYPVGGNYITFQVILYETSNQIKMQYQDVFVSDSAYDYGLTASIGIENSDGTGGLQRGYDQAVLSDSYAVNFYMLPTMTQSAYRFYENADSATPSTALAGNSTVISLTAADQAFRLRMLLHVNGSDFSNNEFSGKLQYVDKGAGSCASPSGGTPSTWTDVSASTDLAFKNNASPSDGASASWTADDPTHGSDSVTNETYEESNNFSNSMGSITVGDDGLWDFSLQDYAMPEGITYCLRAIESDGTELPTYGVYPEVTSYLPASLSFSISDVSIGFGTLSFLAPKYATANEAGAYTSTSAHTLIVSSSGDYVVTVRGDTLTDTAPNPDTTITAITGSSAASSPGSEQFGIYLSPSGGGGSVASNYGNSNQFFYSADAATSVTVGSCTSSCNTNTTYSVYYMANTASATEAGSYSSSLTYIATGTF